MPGGETIVSLTFDDGDATHYTMARPVLAAHGMLGTFYVNSARLGQTETMTWPQLEALNAEGHEIGGHTLDHVKVATVSTAEARRQVHDDRTNLLERGFIVSSFAYPYGDFGQDDEDPSVKSIVTGIVRDCYSSGRGAYGLRNIIAAVDNRPYAVPIPPPDPFGIPTPCCIDSGVTLANLQNYISQAESRGGGWVPLVIHKVCDGGSMSPGTLAGLLDWLEPRGARGTVVRTVSQVISGDTAPPTTAASCEGARHSAGGYGSPVSVMLSASDAGSGVAMIRYTLDGSEPTVSSALYTGPFALSQTRTVQFRAWDNAGNVEATKSQLIRIEA